MHALSAFLDGVFGWAAIFAPILGIFVFCFVIEAIGNPDAAAERLGRLVGAVRRGMHAPPGSPPPA